MTKPQGYPLHGGNKSKPELSWQGGHLAALDGIRALAIALVLCVHSGVPGLKWGWIGVDLFFVLSGFLITSLLLREQTCHGQFDWGAFMIRRTLRLTPAYGLYALFVSIAIWFWPDSEFGGEDGWTAIGLTAAIWTYTINFVPQGGVWSGQAATVHLWSLAVEQQYYLVWPLIILWLVDKPKHLRRFALAASAACLLAFVCWPPGLGRDAMLWTRGFSIIMGSATAIIVHHRLDWLTSAGAKAMLLVGAAGWIFLIGASASMGWLEPDIRQIAIPGIVPSACIVVAAIWQGRWASSSILRWLQLPFVVFIGRISYGIYLFHEIVRIAVWHFLKPAMAQWNPLMGFGIRFVLYLALSVLLAWLSYRYVEMPFNKLGDRFRPLKKG